MLPILQRILVKGGVLSPSELIQIVDMAEQMGLDAIHFGSRQDILFPSIENPRDVSGLFPSINLGYVTNRKYQNIVSSYVSADIFLATSWLSGAAYLYILEQFNYQSKLKINIVDPLQQIVPLFTGHLNFIASEEEDYWFLYLRLEDGEAVQRYPVLIYTWDIANIAQTIEQIYEETTDVNELFEEINNELDTNSRTIRKSLNVPFRAFPYYEGMNKLGSDHYWLGLYWRNNRYDLKFLKAMCELSLECKIGKICLTPWKSFIVKGIPSKNKLLWEKLLGKFGINVRHSSLELNWHLPVADEEALQLKRFLVRNFDQNDISTYGLTFGVKSHRGVNFTSIVIEQNLPPRVMEKFEVLPTFNILYCENFNPNRLRYLTYAQDVDKIELPGLLMELSQLYFNQLGEKELPVHEKVDVYPKSEPPLLATYQCSFCATIYDSRYGDSINRITPGIPFEQLPVDYCCPVCESPKQSFKKIEVLENSVAQEKSTLSNG